MSTFRYEEWLKLYPARWIGEISDDQILTAFEAGEWLSYREIAKRLDVAKSAKLILRIKSLAQEGRLLWSSRRMPNRVDAHVFRVPAREGLCE